MIGETSEDILEGIELERSEAPFREPASLVVSAIDVRDVPVLLGAPTSSWLTCSVVTWRVLSPDCPCPISGGFQGLLHSQDSI
jgi:hypothetical protein